LLVGILRRTRLGVRPGSGEKSVPTLAISCSIDGFTSPAIRGPETRAFTAFTNSPFSSCSASFRCRLSVRPLHKTLSLPSPPKDEMEDPSLFMPLPFPVAVHAHLIVSYTFLASFPPGALDFHNPTPVTSMRCAFRRARWLRPALNGSREEDFAFDVLLLL
jgi:hypothetical protein